MSHPFTRQKLALLALSTLRYSKADISYGVHDAVCEALEGTGPEVTYTIDCFSVCMDEDLYALIDMGDVIEVVGGFSNCECVDQCVVREAEVVVPKAYEAVSEALADSLTDLAEQMEDVQVGAGKSVDMDTLRIVDDCGDRFGEEDGPILVEGEPVVYGVYYELDDDSKPCRVVLAADIEDDEE